MEAKVIYSMPSPNAENGTKKFQNRTNYAILYYRPSHSAVLANLYYKTNRTSARTALGETALGEGLLYILKYTSHMYLNL